MNLGQGRDDGREGTALAKTLRQKELKGGCVEGA